MGGLGGQHPLQGSFHPQRCRLLAVTAIDEHWAAALEHIEALVPPQTVLQRPYLLPSSD